MPFLTQTQAGTHHPGVPKTSCESSELPLLHPPLGSHPEELDTQLLLVITALHQTFHAVILKILFVSLSDILEDIYFSSGEKNLMFLVWI